MEKTITITSTELTDIIAAGAQKALEGAGVTGGLISYNEGVRKWGGMFEMAVKTGEVVPVCKSKSTHAKKAFRISDVLAYMSAQQARTRAIINDLRM